MDRIYLVQNTGCFTVNVLHFFPRWMKNAKLIRKNNIGARVTTMSKSTVWYRQCFSPVLCCGSYGGNMSRPIRSLQFVLNLQIPSPDIIFIYSHPQSTRSDRHESNRESSPRLWYSGDYVALTSDFLCEYSSKIQISLRQFPLHLLYGAFQSVHRFVLS